MAAERLTAGQLPLGSSQAESELLLRQTAEALAARLVVSGVLDIRPALESAAAGGLLNAKQLDGVAATLEAAFALKAQACAPVAEGAGGGGGSGSGAAGDGGKPAAAAYPSLAALAAGIQDEERQLLRAVRTCIKLGDVVSEASEALAAVRQQREANKHELRGAAAEWARAMHARGASDASSYSIVRGRFCVGVKAGRQGDLPKGSLRLGASSTGATLYVEPAPCVPLNNTEAALAQQEEAEVTRVLGFLSRMLGSRRREVEWLLQSVTALDIAAARAKHAVWLGGVRPCFVAEGDATADSPFHMPGARHPVLMQRGLPPLPRPPSADDNRFDRNFLTAPAWETAMRSGGGGAQPDAGGEGGGEAALPKPLDLRVPARKRVVAITGPNTGGKTVTLKAAGLLALMAKAGLFLPCKGKHHRDNDDTSSGGGAGAPGEAAPRLLWFRQVLADIGDAQSLQQNLSTFSGHVRRIKQILSVACPHSLVLLDEVGSGTDPMEGAALARAVLDRLARQARLTLATTHHAELKLASEQDARYVNVSMAFDSASLRPTYALVWGAAGASNALDIAQALGFDGSVVQEARAVAKALAAAPAYAPRTRAAGAGAGVPPDGSLMGTRASNAHIAAVARSLVRQLEDTQAELELLRARRAKALARRGELAEGIREVQALERELRAAPPAIVQERDAIALRLQAALEAFAGGDTVREAVEEQLRALEALIPDEVERWRMEHGGGGGGAGSRKVPGGGGGKGAAEGEEEEDDDDDDRPLRVGDEVQVEGYGDVLGRGTIVGFKGNAVRVSLSTNKISFGTKQGGKGGRPITAMRTEVRRVRASGDQPVAAFRGSELAAQQAMVDRLLGLGSEQDRRAAAKAAAEARAQRLRAQAADEAAAALGAASAEELQQAAEDAPGDWELEYTMGGLGEDDSGPAPQQPQQPKKTPTAARG